MKASDGRTTATLPIPQTFADRLGTLAGRLRRALDVPGQPSRLFLVTFPARLDTFVGEVQDLTDDGLSVPQRPRVQLGDELGRAA